MKGNITKLTVLVIMVAMAMFIVAFAATNKPQAKKSKITQRRTP